MLRWVAVILAALIPWLLITINQSFPFYIEICKQGADTANEQCTGYSAALFFVIEIGKFLNHNEGTVVGLATVAVAAFTKFLYDATFNLATLARNQEETTKTIERAYVQMSHVTNDKNFGLTVNETTGQCEIIISIKNYGTTPARITRIFITKRIMPTVLPEFPQYTPDIGELPEMPVEALLMKDAEIFVGFGFPINPIEISLIPTNVRQMIIYGFVDYTDQFGRHFRGGYARNYIPGLVPNNLIFTRHPNYNYDRPRKEGEGNNWD